MRKNSYLVILKGEKILVFNKSEERYLKLDIDNEDGQDTFLNKWIEKNLDDYNKEIFKFSKDIFIEGSLSRVLFIDATNSNLDIKSEVREYVKFKNIFFGETISYNEKVILNSIFLECMDRNYNSFAVESIKNILYKNKVIQPKKNNVIDESVDKNKIKILTVLTLGIGLLTYKFFFRYLGFQ